MIKYDMRQKHCIFRNVAKWDPAKSSYFLVVLWPLGKPKGRLQSSPRAKGPRGGGHNKLLDGRVF
jgi:hypothetical protein